MRLDMAQLLLLPLCVLSLVIHECAHGAAALAAGDPTPRESGRMTLDPRPHLDLLGTVLLPALLLAFHAPAFFGWARPMPVGAGNLRDPRNDPVRVALAGPLAHLLLAVLSAGLAALAPAEGFFAPGRVIGETLVVWNCSLALLHLVPIPPLDGSWLLMRFLRLRHIVALHQLRAPALVLAGVLLVAPLPTNVVFFGPLRAAVRACLGLFGLSAGATS